jgi:hypothetical protein
MPSRSFIVDMAQLEREQRRADVVVKDSAEIQQLQAPKDEKCWSKIMQNSDQ